jgi:hypothetical protein
VSISTSSGISLPIVALGSSNTHDDQGISSALPPQIHRCPSDFHRAGLFSITK